MEYKYDQYQIPKELDSMSSAGEAVMLVHERLEKICAG